MHVTLIEAGKGPCEINTGHRESAVAVSICHGVCLFELGINQLLFPGNSDHFELVARIWPTIPESSLTELLQPH